MAHALAIAPPPPELTAVSDAHHGLRPLPDWLNEFRVSHRRVRTVRIAVALQVDLKFTPAPVRAVTLDLSAGGFACLLGDAPDRDPNGVPFALRLPSAGAIEGRARVVSATSHHEATQRVSFSFLSIAGNGNEALNAFLMDSVVEELPLT